MIPQETFDRLYNLNTGKTGTGPEQHERPHKPVLLLAVLDLIATGQATQKRIEWNQTLRDRFEIYFEVVGKLNDTCTPENPFCHLRSEVIGTDHFWKPFRVNDSGSIEKLQGPPLVADIGRVFAEINDGFADLNDPVDRELIRSSIVSRYFPAYRTSLTELFQDSPQHPVDRVEEQQGKEIFKRNSAFRKKVISIYDYQCIACGLRIKLPQNNLTFVDAAHIIPFSESHNDHPSNGISLCKNHHWAMDKGLIAPTPDMTWKTSEILIAHRSDGEAELIDLNGRELILPEDETYYPSKASLKWRLDRLRA